jgi:Ni,Fe-hydrogenase maturation factor
MAITTEYLKAAGEVVAAAVSVREAAVLLRTRDTAMRVLVVDAVDMRDEAPAWVAGQRRIYLGSSNGHCWSLTEQLADATALILAQD